MGYCNSNNNIDYNQLRNSIFNYYCDFATPVQGPVYSEGYYISGDNIFFYCSPYNINIEQMQQNCLSNCPQYMPDNDCEPESDPCENACNDNCCPPPKPRCRRRCCCRRHCCNNNQACPVSGSISVN